MAIVDSETVEDRPDDWVVAENRSVSRFYDWLETERDRLPLLIPVLLGIGIAVWQTLGSDIAPIVAAFGLGLPLVLLASDPQSHAFRLLSSGLLLFALGYVAIFVKSHVSGSEPLDRPWIGHIAGQIETVEAVSARGIVRYRLYIGKHDTLPPRVRVNVETSSARPELIVGAIIKLKVRLMPPPGPALPGGYDFARTAWFDGLGATGRAIGSVQLVKAPEHADGFWSSMRSHVARKIEKSMSSEAGAVGAALLVGSRGSIGDADAEALRNSGMAHLLSVSGLHVTAVVGGCFLLVAGLLALWPWFALRAPVPIVAAGASALVAIFYTLLTGAEVPTIRACVAALLILVALAIGREALSLRLLAAGATFVLIFWPEALAGPSFQLSFAAVATIIVLHGSERMRKFGQRREEAFAIRWARGLVSLLLTGLAIELVLAPIALFHFHKSGLYGAIANIGAIPLTTFIIMPAQLLGLALDGISGGAGSPFWWIASNGVEAILWLAHFVSSSPGAVAMLPEMPVWAFGLYAISALILAIFAGHWRWVMLAPLAISLVAMLLSPRPDMLLTGDGQHLAILLPDGKLAMLRPKAGDYARSILGETAAVKESAIDIDDMQGAYCNLDGCSFEMQRGGRRWRILALRSNYMIPAMELASACRRVDIVISSRRLPWSCKPTWIKADAAFLQRSGGLAFYLQDSRVASVAEENAHLPWSAYAPWRLARAEALRAKEKAARELPPPSQNSKPIDQ